MRKSAGGVAGDISIGGGGGGNISGWGLSILPILVVPLVLVVGVILVWQGRRFVLTSLMKSLAPFC